MSQSAASIADGAGPDQPAEEGAPPDSGELHPLLDRVPYRALYALPVEITVSVGTARPLLGELFRLGRDAVIVLDHRIDDSVEIRVGDRLIARGELQELDDGSGRLGVRLTEILDPGGRL